MEVALKNNHRSVRQFMVMARFMCYNLLIHCLFSAVLMLASQVFFTGHTELHDKIISSACKTKLADFVMFVSCVINLLMHCLFSAVLMLASQVFFKVQMELLTACLFLRVLMRTLCYSLRS
jgi:hypothetical protein